ncbi:MAG: hypothetical protein R6V58_13165 [Planctomycetota bacterium]
MPVLVTAAEHPLARRIAARLLEEGGEVRVTADGDVTSLRAAGAFVATATADDEGRLEAALAQVHTLVHVGGGLGTSEPERLVADAEVAARAAAGAGVRRVISLSLPGASPRAADPLRRAKGQVEEVFAALPCPSIVLRVGLVDTPLLRDALLTAGLAPELMGTVVRPVRAADLLELIVAFDRARSSRSEGHLVVAADGPVAMSLVGFLDRVTSSGADRRPSRVGRRLPDEAATARLAAVLAGPWSQDEPYLLDGWDFAGLRPGAPGPLGS